SASSFAKRSALRRPARGEGPESRASSGRRYRGRSRAGSHVWLVVDRLGGADTEADESRREGDAARFATLGARRVASQVPPPNCTAGTAEEPGQIGADPRVT